MYMVGVGTNDLFQHLANTIPRRLDWIITMLFFTHGMSNVKYHGLETQQN